MPLNKTQLETDIEAYLNIGSDVVPSFENPVDVDALKEKQKTALVNAIVKYVASADIPIGIPVATAGSPTAQTGATTSTAKLQ